MSTPCLFPKDTSKGNTATATILISSTVTTHKSTTVTFHLNCCMAESEQKERVHSQFTQLHQQQKWRVEMQPQPKVTNPNVFLNIWMRALV
jgi:hypothetical protein